MSMFDDKKGQSLEAFIETQVRDSIMKAVKEANMEIIESREYMSVREAAKYLSMSESWLRSNFREEGIPYVNRGRILFARRYLDEWYEANLKRNDIGVVMKRESLMRAAQNNQVSL